MIRFRAMMKLLALVAGLSAMSGVAIAQGAPTESRPYLVNPGDQLEVNVWGDERLQKDVRVLPDGTIAFPLAGQLRVEGRSPADIEKMIGERLASEYRGTVPQITVSVKDPAGLQFSVMGRVNSPGNFRPGRYINVLEALSLAGGPSEFANLDNVLIIRKSGNVLSTIRARLGGVFKSGASGKVDQGNIPDIRSGDTVIVP